MQVSPTKHGFDTYVYFKRNKNIFEELKKVNGLTIKEAAQRLNMRSIQLLIAIGHLKKLGIIVEIRIK